MNEETATRPVLLATVIALTMILAACGSATEGTEGTEGTETTIAAVPTTAAPTTAAPTTAAPTTAAPTTAAPTTEPEEDGGGLRAGSEVTGEVSLDVFETPISFTTDEVWLTPVVQPGAVILEDPDRDTPFTRAVLILSAETTEGANIDEWAELDERVTIVSRDETEVSDRGAIVYDLTFDGGGQKPFLTAQCCGGTIIMRSTEYYRVWVIDVESDKPLILFSPVVRGELDWYERAQTIVDTMEIG